MTFHKYTKIKTLGDRNNKGILTIPGKVVIQEKIDGANFAFFVENNILHFCSHNQNLTDSEQIAKTGMPNWKGIKPVLDLWFAHPEKFNNVLYYYAESMQKHTLTYPDEMEGFIGYDILDMRTMELINWKDTKNEFEFLGLPFIHTHFEKDIKDINIDELTNLWQKSVYRDGKAEGIVIKRYDIKNINDDPLFAKIVDDDFKEQNLKAFGRHEQKSKSTDDTKIVEIYCTEGRIEKMIYKLHDEGHEIEMPLMQILPKRITEDILEEEIISIYNKFKNINFRQLNKGISNKCPTILKKVIMENYK